MNIIIPKVRKVSAFDKLRTNKKDKWFQKHTLSRIFEEKKNAPARSAYLGKSVLSVKNLTTDRYVRNLLTIWRIVSESLGDKKVYKTSTPAEELTSESILRERGFSAGTAYEHLSGIALQKDVFSASELTLGQILGGLVCVSPRRTEEICILNKQHA